MGSYLMETSRPCRGQPACDLFEAPPFTSRGLTPSSCVSSVDARDVLCSPRYRACRDHLEQRWVRSYWWHLLEAPFAFATRVLARSSCVSSVDARDVMCSPRCRACRDHLEQRVGYARIGG